MESNSKRIISELRESRRSGHNLFHSQDCAVDSRSSLSEIQRRLSDLPRYNKQIETSIKLEILGKQTGLMSRLIYQARSLLEKDVRPADNLITEQIGRIEQVTQDIREYSDNIERNVGNLEKRYDNTLILLLAKHQESQELARELQEGREKITAQATEEDISQRIDLAISQRKARKRITSNLNRIRLNERAIDLLKSELPILDSLSGIAEAYSFTLKEISQEADLMREHLEVVSSIYLEMMRSQRVNLSLVREVRKLFNYTNNISKALHYGASEIIQRANEGSLVERSYILTGSELSSALEKVEEATFSAFGELEQRMLQYSSNERRLPGNE